MQMTLSLRNVPDSAAVPEGAAAARSAGPARTTDPLRKPRRVSGRVCIAWRLAGLLRHGNAVPKLSRLHSFTGFCIKTEMLSLFTNIHNGALLSCNFLLSCVPVGWERGRGKPRPVAHEAAAVQREQTKDQSLGGGRPSRRAQRSANLPRW